MPKPVDPPRRGHPVSEIAMALAQRKPSEPTSSVQISLNAKGDVQFVVDVTAKDATEAALEARVLFDQLRAAYPRENGGGA